MKPSGYTSRLVDRRLGQLFEQFPALLITGSRATGKTTTAERLAGTVVRLDRENEARAFRDDPDVALRSLAEPVLLDEWQVVPGVLGAVKRAVDEGSGAGRFLLTGSVRDELHTQMWPGTGRVIPVRMWGLTVGEIQGSLPREPFLQKLAHGDIAMFDMPADVPDLQGYVELALRGGYPEPALSLTDAARKEWLRGYLTQLLSRDVEGLGGPRDPEILRRYFEALAVNTAGVVAGKTLYDATGIARDTAVAYERLLTNVFVLDFLYAWHSNRLSRLIKAPKRYLVDPSLLASALSIDEPAVLRDGSLLGRVIETFVLAQIRPELELGKFPARLYHLREKNGRHEIDLVAELSGGDVIAIEIKSSSAPTRGDARHLEWLRERLGEHFLAGAVLHTGPRPFRLSERIFALPIGVLWG